MRVLKPLDRDGYSKDSYVAHASQAYTITSGALNNPDQVSIDLANVPPSNWKTTGDYGYYNYNSGIYSYELFSFINRVFYSSQSLVEYGTQSIAVTKYAPSSSLYVFNIANEAVGEGIVPGTFSIRISGSTIPILDDGNGRLYATNTGSIVGNIFYNHGIGVVEQNSSATTQSISEYGLLLVPFKYVDVAFTSSTTIYEHTITCKISPTEFNGSVFNPSVGYYTTITGSYVSGSETIIYNNYIPSISSSTTALSSEPITGLFDSGSLTPYVTTIGLYNGYELVAIAKLANPVPRTKNVEQTFIIKFDT